MVSVAIDGPAGAGKSTLARRLAAEMGYIYVDTGAMYRAIGLYALRAGKDPKDNDAVNALLPQIELRLASIEGEQHIYLKEEDVSTAIRTEAAGMAASAVGANPTVRAFLLELQRDMAKKQDVLMDGRDIGTVVLPDEMCIRDSRCGCASRQGCCCTPAHRRCRRSRPCPRRAAWRQAQLNCWQARMRPAVRRVRAPNQSQTAPQKRTQRMRAWVHLPQILRRRSRAAAIHRPPVGQGLSLIHI